MIAFSGELKQLWQGQGSHWSVSCCDDAKYTQPEQGSINNAWLSGLSLNALAKSYQIEYFHDFPSMYF